MTPQMKRFET